MATNYETKGRPLYDFAYVHEIDSRLVDLKDLSETEGWDYQFTVTDQISPILYYYFHFTFERVKEQNKIAYADDNSFCCFNTGLVSPNQEPLYALFCKNQMQGREPWRFVKFCRKGEYELTKFPHLPELATYFDDPSCLVYDNRKELRINIEHIIEENKERFPEPFKSMDNHALQMIIRGAVDNAKERVRRNYKAAVPQYYRGKVQLLLPLCLSHPQKADLAILIQEHETFYRAATCLTLEMAYNNARQLARPDKDWLTP